MTVYRLGFPRLVNPSEAYSRENEAQFRQSVEGLLRQVVQATNDMANHPSSFTSTLQFIPDNTIDVGDSATPYRPRSVYAATSMVTPLLVASARVTTPKLGTLTAADVVFDRAGVTQLTLASLAATFAGTAAMTQALTPIVDSVAATDLLLKRNATTKLTLGSANATFATTVTIADTFGLALGNTNFVVFGSAGAAGPAQNGNLRFRHGNTTMQSRNNADNADFNFLQYGSSTFTDNLIVAGASGVLLTPVNGPAVGSLYWKLNTSGHWYPNLTTQDLGLSTNLIRRGYFTNISMQGLDYTWPSSQSANRVLRNTGPGTLAWSQVDLSTDVTGALATGTVPAGQVSAGTFGSGTGGGDYIFPASLTIGTVPADPAVSNYAMWDNSTGRLISLGTEWAQYRYGGAPQFNAYYAGGTSGAPVVPAVNTVMFQLAATGWDTTTSKFGISTRLRMQGVAAEGWVSGSAEGTGYKLLLTGIGTQTTSEVIRWGPGPWTSASTTASVYPDGQLILDRFGTPGIGNYGAALAFTGIANSLRRYVALAPRQTTADVDQMGLSVWVHPNATNTNAMEEIVRFSRSGDLNVGWFGSQLWETDNTSDIGASGATRPRVSFDASASVMGRTLTSALTLANGDQLIAVNYYTIGSGGALTLSGDSVLKVA